jgi:hypothetical protein
MPDPTGLPHATASSRIAPAGAAETPTAQIVAAAVAILEQLRSPRLRGPFPFPGADDLARSAYLHELANWARAATLRSRRTLGARGVEAGLASARRLGMLAELLAAVEGAPNPQEAQAFADAGLGELAAGGWQRRPALRRASGFLDRMGYLGEVIRSAQRTRLAARR